MAVVILTCLVGASGFTASRGYHAYRQANSGARLGDIVAALQDQSDQPGSLAYKVHMGQRVNILMLGYGGAGHDGAYLTDSIMVISVQGPDRVALTSVPRDTYVQIPAFANGGTYDGKINTAYEIPISQGAFGPVAAQFDTGWQGAGMLASKAIGDYLGLTIDYWVGVDFTAFKQVVDALGSVDVLNPYVLDDYQYPQGETGGYTHVHFDAGLLHLNGDQALEYVRERHADSDFGRSRRQQQVIAAIKDKALALGAIPMDQAVGDAELPGPAGRAGGASLECDQDP
ncbi:MAG: LCP family protein [Candidatus Dormibacteria bacterium]